MCTVTAICIRQRRLILATLAIRSPLRPAPHARAPQAVLGLGQCLSALVRFSPFLLFRRVPCAQHIVKALFAPFFLLPSMGRLAYRTITCTRVQPRIIAIMDFLSTAYSSVHAKLLATGLRLRQLVWGLIVLRLLRLSTARCPRPIKDDTPGNLTRIHVRSLIFVNSARQLFDAILDTVYLVPQCILSECGLS